MSYVKDVATSSQHVVGGSVTYVVPISVAPGSGNTLILHVASTGAQASAVTDTKGNTWVKAKGQTAAVAAVQFYCQQDVAALTTSDTITITFGTTAIAYMVVIMQEHSGILTPSPLDQTAGHNTSTASTTRDAGTTATTAQASEVVIATFAISAIETSFTPGTGYSVGTNAYVAYTAGNLSCEAEFAYVSATGAYNPTATGGVSATGGGVTVTYKQASAGSTKSIAGTISAPSTVGGNVTAKHRIAPTSGIQAISALSGGTGSTGGGTTGAPSAGYGVSTYGAGTYGEISVIGGTGGGGGGTGGGGGGGAVTPNQPSIIPPGTPTGDAIIDFIESSPPGLFPENDDSNFGFAIRGLWAAKIEDLISQQDLLYKERFASTSDTFLDEWERMTGTPADPAGLDTTTRRAVVLGRIRKGPFTRAKRKEIVERYLKATFGGGVTFGPGGLAIGTGITLTGGTTAPDVSTVYKIVENITGFSYTVYILNTYTPSAGMQRELARITPAGISFTISYVATLP